MLGEYLWAIPDEQRNHRPKTSGHQRGMATYRVTLPRVLQARIARCLSANQPSNLRNRRRTPSRGAIRQRPYFSHTAQWPKPSPVKKLHPIRHPERVRSLIGKGRFISKTNSSPDLCGLVLI
jgi:hypothetical protein